MTTEPSPTTHLLPGQSLRMAVDAGLILRVAQGSVEVTAPPAWLGETMFSPKTMLDEGQSFIPERSGWIEVKALSPARVDLASALAEPPLASRAARWMRVLTGGVAWR